MQDKNHINSATSLEAIVRNGIEHGVSVPANLETENEWEHPDHWYGKQTRYCNDLDCIFTLLRENTGVFFPSGGEREGVDRGGKRKVEVSESSSAMPPKKKGSH